MKTQNDNTECNCYCHVTEHVAGGVYRYYDCQHCTDTKEDKGSESETFEDWEKIEKELTPVMENKVASVIGEDGLTVWDFAELRDSLIDFIHQQRQQVREQTIKYMAFCECGDALERKELYPSEATYYCFGCDKSYKLKQPTDRKGGKL